MAGLPHPVRVRAGAAKRRARIALFNQRALARNREHALAIGDSHIRVFEHMGDLLPVRFSVEFVRGATAMGVANPNSKSRALAKIERRLALAKPWQPVITLMGEVDCGFAIWIRAEKEGISIEEQLGLALDTYLGLLARIRARFPRVYVLSAPLPTIRDGEDWGEVRHLRRAVQATQRERTDLTLRFNEELEARCRRHGLVFVDTTTVQLDPATNLVREDLLNSDPLDHHLERPKYARILADALAPHLGRNAVPSLGAAPGARS